MKLHSKSHMTSKQIEEIAVDFSNNISFILHSLKSEVINSVDKEKVSYVLELFDIFLKSFDELKTEYID